MVSPGDPKNRPEDPTISVVIPVYNEVTTIEELLLRVQAVAIDKEIVIIDDGSTDGTRQKLEKLAQQDKRPESFFHGDNRGKGGCFAGLASELPGGGHFSLSRMQTSSMILRNTRN